MKLVLKEGTIETFSADVIITFAFENDYESLKQLDSKLSIIKAIYDKKEFTGELYSTRLLATCGTIVARHIFLVGLGKKTDVDTERMRKASAHAVRILRDGGYKSIALLLHPYEAKESAKLFAACQAITEGIHLANYQFVKYKTDKDKIKTLDDVTLVGSKHYESAITKGTIIAESQLFTRDLVNEPPNVLTPTELANRAKTEAEKHGIKTTIYDKKKITELGMNALLAVNRGSTEEPRFIILEYKGGDKGPYALVGKGITFDSGGLDIKLSPNMETMKCDMAGGAAVISAIIAAARLKLPVHLYAIVASTENMPSGSAYKTGDIITTFSKKTIEIINTDAEGRVILSDALAYAATLKPKAIIDLATLTGACVVALGSVAAGIFGNNQPVVDSLIAAGQVTYERVWQFPLFDEYKDNVKSELADVRNLSLIPREAGAIAGAAFLEPFVDKTPWAHIDIAGPAWSNDSRFYWQKGGSGFGVRLLVKFLEDLK